MLPLLQELAREACTFPLHAKTHWNNPRWNADAPPFNLIQVEMPRESGIPVDFLPILDYARYRPPAAAENINTLGELACSFLGFSSIVRRHIAAAPIRATILENIPRLPMKMFIYRRSKGARDEHENYLSAILISIWMRAGRDPIMIFLRMRILRTIWLPIYGKQRRNSGRISPKKSILIRFVIFHATQKPNLRSRLPTTRLSLVKAER